MYPMFSSDPASIVVLDCFRVVKVLIFTCIFVGLTLDKPFGQAVSSSRCGI